MSFSTVWRLRRRDSRITGTLLYVINSGIHAISSSLIPMADLVSLRSLRFGCHLGELATVFRQALPETMVGCLLLFPGAIDLFHLLVSSSGHPFSLLFALFYGHE
jgi:hypothetical protein